MKSRIAIITEDSKRLLKDVNDANLPPELELAVKNLVNDTKSLALLKEEETIERTDEWSKKRQVVTEAYKNLLGKFLEVFDQVTKEKGMNQIYMYHLKCLMVEATTPLPRSIYQ